MLKDKDLGTTIIGGIIAAATAAEPVISVAHGTWTGPVILQLVSSVLIAVFGYITNKADASE